MYLNNDKNISDLNMGVNTPQKRAKLIKTLTLSFTIDKLTRLRSTEKTRPLSMRSSSLLLKQPSAGKSLLPQINFCSLFVCLIDILNLCLWSKVFIALYLIITRCFQFENFKWTLQPFWSPVCSETTLINLLLLNCT